MSIIGKRFRQLREGKNLTREKIFAATGIPVSTLKSIELGNRTSPRKETKEILLKYYGISEADLYIESNSHQLQKIPQDVIKVPVVSWVYANQFADVSDPFPVGVSDTYVYSSTRGKNMFALKVKNNCMEPEFLEGDIIIINPESEAGNGDFVIVRDTQSKEATFKQLKIYGKKTVLHPLNPRYQDIEINKPDRYEIIGKVVQKLKNY